MERQRSEDARNRGDFLVSSETEEKHQNRINTVTKKKDKIYETSVRVLA
jgi:hypothetical protein